MTTADDAIRAAAEYIGTSGTDNIFNTWYWGQHVYDDNMYPWCAAFQSYIYKVRLAMAVTASASAAGFANQFPRIDDSQVQPGDLVVFNWDGRQDTGWCDHIGMVEWFDHGSQYFGTIEGNTGWAAGGEVARVTRYNESSYFTAFFRPNYDGSAAPGGDGGDPGSSGGSQGGSGGGLRGGEWQGLVKGRQDTTGAGDDYAGVFGKPMLYIAAKGIGPYQASSVQHGFWPEVTGYDLNDEENGMAGDGFPIDRFRCQDATVYYQTHNLGGDWNEPMLGLKDLGGTSDDFAGDKGVKQDAIRMWREDGEQPEYNVYS